MLAFHPGITHRSGVFEGRQQVEHLGLVLDHVGALEEVLALLERFGGSGGSGSRVDEAVVALGADNGLADVRSARLSGAQVGETGGLGGDSVGENILLFLHALELGSLLGLLVREVDLLGALVGFRAHRQVGEPAVGVGDEVGVGEACDAGLRFDVVLFEDFVLGVHRRQHTKQPLLVRRLLDNLEGSALEGRVEGLAACRLLATHMGGDHLSEDSSSRWVEAVEQANLGALRQPEGLVADAALHEGGRHDGFSEFGREELVAAKRAEEAGLIVDESVDLCLR